MDNTDIVLEPGSAAHRRADQIRAAAMNGIASKQIEIGASKCDVANAIMMIVVNFCRNRLYCPDGPAGFIRRLGETLLRQPPKKGSN